MSVLLSALLNSPHFVVPDKQHSYKDSAPSWWEIKIKNP